MNENSISIYKKVIENCPNVELKGKNMLYTSSNGHMFSQLNKAGEIGIRFSKTVQEKYFDELDTTYFKSYGAKMNGYVLIPEKMWKNMDKMVALMEESHDYVNSLDPK